MSSRDCCCVVDQFCDAPANLEHEYLPHHLAKCFCCGQSVCVKCSTRRKYLRYGRVRLCNNCQIEMDGNDKLVMKRIYKMAGY